MSLSESPATPDPEFTALMAVHAALKGLSADIQERVLIYVARKLGLSLSEGQGVGDGSSPSSSSDRTVGTATSSSPNHAASGEADDDLEGISPVAKKWMTRNGLSASGLSALFSLGVDEIDLVTNSIPGSSIREKVRSVVLLKGVAAYLSTGTARITHEDIKEACLHYDAYDSPNHAKYLKQMAAELNGTKESGYSLTPRGLSNATELAKQLISGETK